MASDLMDDAFGMSGYDPDAMDKVIQADGGQADTLFYKLTHACGCMYFTERVSAHPPGLPFSLYIPIGVYLVRISYSYQPSAYPRFSYPLALEAGLLEHHA